MRSHPLKGETNETTQAETRVLQRLVINYCTGELARSDWDWPQWSAA